MAASKRRLMQESVAYEVWPVVAMFETMVEVRSKCYGIINGCPNILVRTRRTIGLATPAPQKNPTLKW
jgi:hypothetical protein